VQQDDGVTLTLIDVGQALAIDLQVLFLIGHFG
jgi:hypothetical protein